jgi:hypothetical protein
LLVPLVYPPNNYGEAEGPLFVVKANQNLCEDNQSTHYQTFVLAG